ncbi:MAG: hypothetical protein H6738_12330 [Alphaproteobacteria bacterium]|nr:hypothetical protein [Alphaproteobacteria bacterium]
MSRTDGLVVCTGGLELTAELVGRLEVTDREVCARWDGGLTCLRPGARRTSATPFVELVRGPGTPCGRDGEGAVWCLAPGADDETAAEVHGVPLPAPATALGADGARIFALLVDGTLWTWPPSGHGRPLTPVQVASGVTLVDSEPWTRLCALVADRVRCWSSGAEEPPRTVSGARALAVGRAHTCALGDDGVVCWGDGTLGQTSPPPLTRPTALDAGDDRTCAIDEGELRCWGPP